MNEWLKEEAGWYTHPIYGGVCKEKNGWYAYPMRYDSDVSMGPYRTLAIAKDKIRQDLFGIIDLIALYPDSICGVQ